MDVAQLVRASVCGAEGRRFEPGLPPKHKASLNGGAFFVEQILNKRKRVRSLSRERSDTGNPVFHPSTKLLLTEKLFLLKKAYKLWPSFSLMP